MTDEKISKVLEYTKLTEEELKVKLEEAKKELRNVFEISDEKELEDMAIQRVYTMYARKNLSMAIEYEGILLNYGSITDFGARGKYNEIKEKFDSGDDVIKRSLYDAGFVNTEGDPLWNKENAPIWRITNKEGDLLSTDDRIMKPEKELRRQAIGIFKGPEDKQYIGSTVNIYGKGDVEIPVKTKIKIKLTGKLDEKTGLYKLSTSIEHSDFERVNDEVLSYTDYLDMINTYFKDYVFDFNVDTFKNWLVKNEDHPLVFVINGNVARAFSPDDSTKDNVITLVNINNKEESLSCFTSRKVELPQEMTGNIIVAGSRVTGDSTKGYLLNTVDLMTKYKPKKHEEIKPEEGKEETPKEKPSWLG